METTAKEKLIADLEYLSEEQAKVVRDVLRVFWNQNNSKGALMTLAYGEGYTGIDSALPHEWVNQVQNIHPDFKTGFHVMNYNTERWGKVENVAEELVVKLFNTFKQ